MSSSAGIYPDEHKTLVDRAFSQAVEARKRVEYVTAWLTRGDVFGASQDCALALAELGDVCRDLAALEELVGIPISDEPADDYEDYEDFEII